MIDLCNVPRIVRRCECGKRLAQCNHSHLCFVCQQQKINAATQMKFEPDKTIYKVTLSEERKQAIMEGLKRMSMHDATKVFGCSLATVSNIVRDAGERPNCPHGCGKPLHAGVCKGNPKYKRSRVNLAKAHKQLAKPGPFTMADAAAFFGVEA